MKSQGGDPPLSSSLSLFKLSQANQNELKGLANYKGLSFCLLDENREGFSSKVEENLKTYMRGQASFLVSKLGGDWSFSHENASFIIIMLSSSKDKGQLEQLIVKHPSLKQNIKESLYNL